MAKIFVFVGIFLVAMSCFDSKKQDIVVDSDNCPSAVSLNDTLVNIIQDYIQKTSTNGKRWIYVINAEAIQGGASTLRLWVQGYRKSSLYLLWKDSNFAPVAYADIGVDRVYIFSSFSAFQKEPRKFLDCCYKGDGILDDWDEVKEEQEGFPSWTCENPLPITIRYHQNKYMVVRDSLFKGGDLWDAELHKSKPPRAEVKFVPPKNKR